MSFCQIPIGNHNTAIYNTKSFLKSGQKWVFKNSNKHYFGLQLPKTNFGSTSSGSVTVSATEARNLHPKVVVYLCGHLKLGIACGEWWSPESDLLQVERILDDAGGGDSHPEDVLLRGQVVCGRYSVYVREVTTHKIRQLYRWAVTKCCGSGSKLDPQLSTLWIRICNSNTDPNPRH